MGGCGFRESPDYSTSWSPKQMGFKKGKRYMVAQDDHGKNLLPRLRSRAKIMEEEMEFDIFCQDGG
jgi:hypothetical protein